LLHIVFDPARTILFVRAADLAHHDHGFGLRIVVEKLHHVDVLEPVHRIAADTHTTRLTQTECGKLPDRFIRERAGAGHHPDRPFHVDMTGHDPDLELVGCDDSGTI